LDVVVSFGHRLINGLTRRVFVALSARLAPMISNHQKGLAGSIKPAAPNAGIVPQLTIEHLWPGVGEPERYAI